ncbi:hypothetical protein XELAEV_18033035mg [Xenopus laevis]|uniref:Helix-turn-helix domain-containing protein n=1 Tax=Xenopus laevis TaxID=8355 RepID=A0A974CK13_XENLA|nr:hypothetical protein XELAEV_18033035mg [Xenopus laevis]
MAKLEEDFLSTCNTKPLIYLRYIDDIFIIWTDTEQEFIQFHKQFQDFHPIINLKMNYSPTHIHFLDTTIHIREDTIQTTIYRKQTDKPSYLMYDSFHPDHTKHSIIYSQALRYNRIYIQTPMNRHLKTLKADFINRGYNPMIVDQYIHAATRIPRTHLLQYKQNPEINWVPLVVTYISQQRTLRKIARDLQGTLHKDERLKSIFPDPPLLASQAKVTNNKKGTIYRRDWAKSEKENTHHRFTITNKKLDTPIGNHFNGFWLRILVLKGNLKTDNERKVCEYKLMETFNSLKNGLNLGLGFMANYVD